MTHSLRLRDLSASALAGWLLAFFFGKRVVLPVWVSIRITSDEDMTCAAAHDGPARTRIKSSRVSFMGERYHGVSV